MSKPNDNQIAKWLNKLERESWQLELLVSAFTIFLLFQGIIAFEELLDELTYKYNVGASFLSFVFIFANLLYSALKALTFFMVSHLLLRGFWIGTIGLRSVQPEINFDDFKYTPFFTKKLKDTVVSLDQLVLKLDEVCSVIFAFAFLVISLLISFGTYLAFIGVVGLILSTISDFSLGWLSHTLNLVFILVLLIYFISGLIYLIDYFTLDFFKKRRRFQKVYYPFYKVFHYITLGFLSRSIYYYLISKFSKKRIRIVYTIGITFVLLLIIFDFDQYQYSTHNPNPYQISTNTYDDQRVDSEYVDWASIPSAEIEKDFIPLFLRYDPADNEILRKSCPDYEPVKSDGINLAYKFVTSKGGLHFTNEKFEGENPEKIMDCRKSIFKVSINDSLYSGLEYFFYTHPAKKQHGLLSYIPTSGLQNGQNVMVIEKATLSASDSIAFKEFVRIPFWYSK